MRKVLTVAVIAMMLLSLGVGVAVAKEKFKGTVQQLPFQSYIGDWVIDGRIVQVTPGTKLEFDGGPAQVGSFVEVKGITFQGQFIATKIETKRSRR